ncbi:MAG TPA: tetratricopeptide repeat protein [Candidatus Polarisedimenticolaceae bacterium]|nr:tetratricopeptide repeat protein [Candidatus Polarisedimenticolaceae bacterium]
MSAGAGATPYQMADELYRQGLAALVLKRSEEALWSFRSALKLYRSAGALPSWRCLSYFGLSLALTNGNGTPEAVRACESALKNDKYDGQLYLNLGRVYLLSGRRGKAIQTFERGLVEEPDHTELRKALREAERRAPPVISMLARAHPLNVYLGKRRARRQRV